MPEVSNFMLNYVRDAHHSSLVCLLLISRRNGYMPYHPMRPAPGGGRWMNNDPLSRRRALNRRSSALTPETDRALSLSVRV